MSTRFNFTTAEQVHLEQFAGSVWQAFGHGMISSEEAIAAIRGYHDELAFAAQTFAGTPSPRPSPQGEGASSSPAAF